MSTPARQRTEASVTEKFHAASISRLDPLATTHHVHLGDARDMHELTEPRSLDLVVTSPPYWTLKEYDGSAGESQLGHFDGYEGFHDELAKVWQRCFDLRVPGAGCAWWWGTSACLARRRRHLVMPLHADISIRCRAIGFDYLTPILWYKIANASTEVEGNGSLSSASRTSLM